MKNRIDVAAFILLKDMIPIRGRFGLRPTWGFVRGRPKIYGTTQFFLENFGLKNLDELPAADELRRIEVELTTASNTEDEDQSQLNFDSEADEEADDEEADDEEADDEEADDEEDDDEEDDDEEDDDEEDDDEEDDE